MVNRRDAMKAAAGTVIGAALPAAPEAKITVAMRNEYIGWRHYTVSYDPAIDEEELLDRIAVLWDRLEKHPPLDS